MNIPIPPERRAEIVAAMKRRTNWSVSNRVPGTDTWHHGGPLFATQEDAEIAARNSVGSRLEWVTKEHSGHKPDTRSEP